MTQTLTRPLLPPPPPTQAVNVVDLDERMYVQKGEWNPDPLGIGMGSPTAQCTGTSILLPVLYQYPVQILARKKCTGVLTFSPKT